VFVALFGLAAANATGCVQLNASHCANLQGTATCEERGAGVCSKCTSENDGCVQTVDADCAADIGATESGTTTESVTGTGSTTVGMSMSSTSVTSSTTVEPGTDESTTMEPRMDVGPSCGDGEINQEIEACDGTALSEPDCAALGYETGQLSCTDACIFDVSDCDGAPNPCGNGMLEDWEQCDGSQFGDNTCEELLGEEYSGSPYCTNECEIVDTTCCLEAGAPCIALDPDYECCPGTSCVLGGPMLTHCA
jgi:hypothetical protein